LSENQKPIKYLVIGFPKCGQTSLVEYLIKRLGGESVADRAEIIWKPDGLELFEKNGYAEIGYRPVIIIRDPIQRIWSDWNHLGRGYGFKTFEDYIANQKQTDLGGLGEYNPITRSNYEKFIKRWQKYNPIVLELEEMKKNPNFGHRNKGKQYDEDYELIPTHFREMCERLLAIETSK
jgi:hypothetical protein